MRRRKGQSTAEYVVVVGVVVAAIVAMQVYVKRGLQAKIKGASGHLTDQFGTTKQYEPYYANSTYNVTQDRLGHEKVEEGGKVRRTFSKDETTRTGSSKTEAPQ